MPKTSVLIVNGNIISRDAIRRALDTIDDISLNGVAVNGKTGLDRIRQKAPDIVIFGNFIDDIDAVDFTCKALEINSGIGIIIGVSSDDEDSARHAVSALSCGAFDFFLLTNKLSADSAAETIRRILLPKIRCFAIQTYSRLAKGIKSRIVDEVGVQKVPDRKLNPVEKRTSVIKTRTALGRKFPGRSFEVVVVGVSTGGPEALIRLLSSFPSDFHLPIIIVLHMPSQFTGPMAEELKKKSNLNVKETEDGECVQPKTVYLAKGGIHLTLEKATRARILLRFDDSAAVNGCKPSVDVLFSSAAEIYRQHCIAVILTGMGNDGLKGVNELKKYDVPVIVQDEETSVVWGMPGSVVKAGMADDVVPIGNIADKIIELTGEV